MARLVRVTDVEELRDIFSETFLTKQDKVTKVSDNSVMSGTAFGVAKVGQKAIAELAGVEAILSPDIAVGEQLDRIASNYGIAPRYTASQSSVRVRLVGAEGTQYVAGGTTITGSQGIEFELEEDITIGEFGFEYASFRSFTTGSSTNVPALTLNRIDPIPNGHQYVINEFTAIGGRDNESDELFRRRIKEGVNILAKGTLASLEQAFIKINNNVLKVFYQGLDDRGNVKIAIVTQNGVTLSTNELGEIQEQAENLFSLADQRPFGKESFGVILSNIEFEPIDISFRASVKDGFNPDTYRQNAQIAMSKLLDFRNFNSGVDKVEWDDLLQAAKNARGAKYIPDQFFFVNSGRRDLEISPNKLPRIRSFVLFDRNGNVIQDLEGNFNPVFYQNQPDFNLQQTLYRSI